MSELDKENEKKRSGPKILLVIVIIYFVLALIFTLFSIYFYNQNNISFIKYVTNFVKNNKIEKTPLNEKYAFNNIEITEWKSKLRENDIVDGYSSEMTYVEISGLKDKNVQNKINNKIKEKVRSFVSQEEILDNNIVNVNINSYVYGNFSNILSISISKYITKFKENPVDEYDDYEYEDEIESLNFRLDTGDEIEFKDVFTKDASIKRILSQCAYRDLAFDYGMYHVWDNMDEDTSVPSMDNVDYSHVERLVYNLVNEFNNGKSFPFFIQPNEVYFIYDKNYITINLADYSDYIGVYEIVPNDSDLYEKGNLEKKDYVFGYPYISSFVYNDKVNSNTYLIINSPYNKKYSEEEYNSYSKTVYEYLDELKKYIEENSKKDDKAKIYIISSIYLDEENQLTFYGEKMVIDSEELDDKDIENVLIEACKQSPEGDSSLSFYCFIDTNDVYWFNVYDNNYTEEKYQIMDESIEE